MELFPPYLVSVSYVSDNISVQVYKPGLRLSLPGNRKVKISNIPETHKRKLVTDISLIRTCAEQYIPHLCVRFAPTRLGSE